MQLSRELVVVEEGMVRISRKESNSSVELLGKFAVWSDSLLKVSPELSRVQDVYGHRDDQGVPLLSLL